MKKLIVALVALGFLAAFLAVPETLGAASREGARLVITLTSGEVVKGELIGVRAESLVLLTDLGDRTVNIGEAATLLVKDKSGKLIGGMIGLTAGVILDASMWHSLNSDKSEGADFARVLLTPGAIVASVLLVGGGALSGMLIGNAVHKGKTYKIPKMAPEEIRSLMGTLRKKAMVPDYK